jgi:hypothetical protein
MESWSSAKKNATKIIFRIHAMAFWRHAKICYVFQTGGIFQERDPGKCQ